MENQKTGQAEDKICVKIDPEIQELIPGFLKNRRQDVAMIPQALEKKDYEAICTVAHGMRGAGAGYGFNEISKIGQNMEEAALAKNDLDIQKQFRALASYLDRLEIVYDESA